ncbi:transglutaminase-like cysteine peptidase [Bradyrhizobium diazoefficiens]|uniref:transglutaminase-like cysteine peptidase n=1 Tax=Bradyrhizobium diazoefficiens TaxID=1355477 RepID=UPI00190DAD89|nr:transglutaminase-like cysteine peptidase [Bradyrhizobium diazoefficiens]QQO17715.1 transglutaminase-like cysteine peptidase [Bradyrhizobium diazoefficiens]
MTRFCRERRTARRLGAWTVAATAAAAVFAWDALPAHAFLARPALFAAIGSATKAPSGWLQLCAANADECKPLADQARDVTLTPELLEQLYRINKYVNDRVTWTSDAELYGKTERWAYPLDRGDCEDMVLLKRRLLVKTGWPQGALLITIVEERGQNRTRHAVLTVRSNRGEMILDNQTPEILFWYETNYRYLSRQSATDPNVWVSFGPEPAKPAVDVAVASSPSPLPLPPPLGIRP